MISKIKQMKKLSECAKNLQKMTWEYIKLGIISKNEFKRQIFINIVNYYQGSWTNKNKAFFKN